MTGSYLSRLTTINERTKVRKWATGYNHAERILFDIGNCARHLTDAGRLCVLEECLLTD